MLRGRPGRICRTDAPTHYKRTPSAGVAVAVPRCYRLMLSHDPVMMGALASLFAGAATGLGALPLLGLARLDARRENAVLGFAAGVMLTAAFYSLILPAVDAHSASEGPRLLSAFYVGLSVMAGAGLLALLDHILPEAAAFRPANEDLAAGRARQLWMLVLAMTLHNIPEGMAVGIGFADGQQERGISTAIGIGVQNIPEGMAVAGAMLLLGQGRRRAIMIALASGLVEPVAGTLAAAVVAEARSLLPWGLGLAAGAMVHIVVSQILPDCARRTDTRSTTPAFLVGLGTMMILDLGLQ